jgi:hypothetical protein
LMYVNGGSCGPQPAPAGYFVCFAGPG